MHPAVELLLARMESNPEEFSQENKVLQDGNIVFNNRWSFAITKIQKYASKEEVALITNRISEINMGELHKQIMKELCAPNEAKLITTPEMRQQMLDLWKKELSA